MGNKGDKWLEILVITGVLAWNMGGEMGSCYPKVV